MNSIKDQLIKAIRSAAVYNPEVQDKPACILWPDADGQWQAVLPMLKTEMAELLELGDYAPESKCGPAIWLRCVLAGAVEEVPLSWEIPIIYLPGVSRQNLRAVESCPDYLKPLAELQYRGTIWNQLNSKDWTILAYLKSDQGGLGLDVSKDSETKNSMQLSLLQLLDEDLTYLKGKYLDKDYFNTLLTGGDPTRDFLQWLEQGDAFKAGRADIAWRGFVEVCKSQLAFNPDKGGLISAAQKLAEGHGPWQAVWQRFCDSPQRYTNIVERIKDCSPNYDLFSDAQSAAGWPQWNTEKEAQLLIDLKGLENLNDSKARARLKALEKEHSPRRELVWAELGEAPLATALEYLAELAEVTSNSLSIGGIDNIRDGYVQWGWQADNAALKALDAVTQQKDVEAVTVAVRSVYMSWMETSARYLQNEVYDHGYPGKTALEESPASYQAGTCVLFVDGLRMDTAKRLTSLLRSYHIEEKAVWSGLPSVTATGKPKVSPAGNYGRGELGNVDFEPVVSETGQSLNDYHIKRLLKEDGWQILEGNNCGDGKGFGWISVGDIDHEGHDRGWKLAKHVDVILSEIRERVESLFAAGWKKIHIVTDHGWLLLPGGLPKINLPSALASSKWGRCAMIKPGAVTDEHLFPWYWNKDQTYALASGISCYKNGTEYTHGGLSLQECLNLELVVTKDEISIAKVEFTDIKWTGLRCKVACDGDVSGLRVDIRTSPGDSDSSIVMGIKKLKEGGTASVVVEDEDLEGHKVMIVLIDDTGQLVTQHESIVGGE